MQTNAEKFITLSQQFNEGAPIAASTASDLKQLREATKRMNADMPPRPDVATGAGVFLGYGVDFAFDPLRFMPAQHRLEILSDLLDRGVLSDYVRGEEVEERVLWGARSISWDPLDLTTTYDVTGCVCANVGERTQRRGPR